MFLTIFSLLLPFLIWGLIALAFRVTRSYRERRRKEKAIAFLMYLGSK